MKRILLAVLLLCADVCFGQGLKVQFQQSGTPVQTFTKWLPINCSTNLTCTFTNGILVMTASSTAATAFSALTGSTNTSAAMVVGAGASLAPASTGTITANLSSGTAIAQTGVDINTSFQVTALHLASPLGTSQGGTGAASLAAANIALTTATLAQFAATSSAQLAGVISDETGSGLLMFATNPLMPGYHDVTEIAAPANPSAGNERWYASSSTHLMSCLTSAGASCAPSGGSSAWSSLTAPTGAGNFPLAMGSNTSIFTTTTALSQMFGWKNTTAAVVGTSQGSPVLSNCGTAFHASASVEDCMTFSELPGNGNDAAITFTIGHTGTSTGTVTTQFPGPIAAGNPGGVGGALSLPEGTAASAVASSDVCYADSTAHAVKCSYNNGSFFQATQTIASGTSAMGTSAIASGACATVVTTSATGTATTDVFGWGFNGDPTAVTGYAPTTNGMLTIIAYPTANNVNYKVCNNTSASITPGAITLNWRVTR